MDLALEEELDDLDEPNGIQIDWSNVHKTSGSDAEVTEGSDHSDADADEENNVSINENIDFLQVFRSLCSFSRSQMSVINFPFRDLEYFIFENVVSFRL